MRIIQSHIVKNISGYLDRLERGTIQKHYNIAYEHIKEPILIQQPDVENLNSLVVVHDQMEEYI